MSMNMIMVMVMMNIVMVMMMRMVMVARNMRVSSQVSHSKSWKTSCVASQTIYF